MQDSHLQGVIISGSLDIVLFREVRYLTSQSIKTDVGLLYLKVFLYSQYMRYCRGFSPFVDVSHVRKPLFFKFPEKVHATLLPF